MPFFTMRDGELHAEDVPLSTIADTVQTPTYVYSAAAIRRAAGDFRAAFADLPRTRFAFAVKANPNVAVLSLLRSCGFGADIVSAGELACALAAGMAAKDVVFSGVGKSRRELGTALDAGVGQFNLELEAEGIALSALALVSGRRATAVLRVNPDVDAGTHAKISTGRRENKFGVAIADAPAIYERLARLPGLDLVGVAVHIGSQLTSLAPLEAAFDRVGALLRTLRAGGHRIDRVDLGGGLGVAYLKGETPPTPADYAAMIRRVSGGWDVALTVEPGRAIVASAGVLLTGVLWVKPGVRYPFVIVDAGMNDLARPAMYDAWHAIEAVRPTGDRMTATVVGPVCESSDTFAAAREIDALGAGDLAVIRDAGAYGASMASMYNARPLVPEVLVDGDRCAIVADRIGVDAALTRQHVPAWLDAPLLRTAA